MIPPLILLFSWIDTLQGKREKINWKLVIIAFAISLIIDFSFSFYYKMKYGFPIFPNMYSIKTILLIAGIISALIVLSSLILLPPLRKQLSIYFSLLLVFCIIGSVIFVFILYIGILFKPLGDKMNFAQSLDKAFEIAEMTEGNSDFQIIKTQSEKQCYSRSSQTNCDYDNIFFIKNNLDEPKEVRVKFVVYDRNDEVQKEIMSHKLKLDAGEIRLVTTDETLTEGDIWDQYTFRTDKMVVFYEYSLEYQDIQ